MLRNVLQIDAIDQLEQVMLVDVQVFEALHFPEVLDEQLILAFVPLS